MDTPAIFCVLSDLAKDLAARLAIVGDGDNGAKRATVTIRRRSEKVA